MSSEVQIIYELKGETVKALLELSKSEENWVVNAIKAGEKLIAYKKMIGHGSFYKGLENVFGISTKKAERLMQAYNVYGKKRPEKLATLSMYTIFELSAPSTPKKVREEVATELEEGKTVTVKQVREKKKIEKQKPFSEKESIKEEEENNDTLVHDFIIESKSVLNVFKNKLRFKEQSFFDKLTDKQKSALKLLASELFDMAEKIKELYIEKNIIDMPTVSTVKEKPKKIDKIESNDNLVMGKKAIRIAKLLGDNILFRVTHARIPKIGSKRFDIWAEQIGAMSKKYTLKYKDFILILRYIKQSAMNKNGFSWGIIIQSPTNLAEHFPTIYATMTSGYEHLNGKDNTNGKKKENLNSKFDKLIQGKSKGKVKYN